MRHDDLGLSGEELLAASGEVFLAVDSEGAVTYTDERARSLIRRPGEGLVGRQLWDLLPEASDALRRALTRALAERTAVDGTVSLTAPMPTWLAVRAVPHRGGALVFLREIPIRDHIEEEARRLAAVDAALREVATAVVGGAGSALLFELIARKTGELLDADGAGVLQFEPAGSGAILVGGWSKSAPSVPIGTRFADPSLLELRSSIERPVHVGTYDDPRDLPVRFGYHSAIAAGLRVEGETWGILSVGSRAPDAFTEIHLDRFESFAQLLELAITRIAEDQRLAMRASRDALTGLVNHRAFHERLADEVRRAERHDRPLALMLMDVDNFKAVNDSFGHQEGDRLLSRIGSILADSARAEDVVARIGGDEFAVLLPDTTAEQAAAIAERIRAGVRGVDFSPADVVTLSIGVTDLAFGLTSDGMVQLADGALYWSKGHGRDRVCVYEPEVVRELSAGDRAEHLARSQSLLGLRALARAIDAKDPSTSRHSDRVARLVGKLAEESGWGPDDVALLTEAAMVHDVGKLGVPDAVLLKPDRFTGDEYEQIKRHVELGASIVDDVLQPIQVRWIRCHHERPDGRGYPEGLPGEAIPAGAALLAVADCWDVMTVSRPYQPAKGVQAALEECRRLVGSQFTAEAVAALQRVIARGDICDTRADHPSAGR